MDDSTNEYVYVAEAYKDGDRVEQIVHTTRQDAKEDIQVSTNLDNPDRIEINKRKVYLGHDDRFLVTK